MATPFIGELKIFSCNFAPKGWASCNGQLLSIQSNAALFSLLGTTYGGNGTNTFGLPNLQARVPIHQGNGYALGQTAGEAAHTIVTNEMPAHNHLHQAATAAPSTTDPPGGLFATSTDDYYAPPGPSQVGFASAMLATTGGSQPHENRQPFLVLNVCIALTGIFPSRN